MCERRLQRPAMSFFENLLSCQKSVTSLLKTSLSLSMLAMFAGAKTIVSSTKLKNGDVVPLEVN